MPDILHLIAIDAPAERVFDAITTTAGVQGWWTRDAVIDADRGEFGFYSRRTVTKVAVTENVPPSRVAWTITDSTLASWHGTSITFDLRTEDGATVLRFAHRGFAQADDNYARVTTGWGYYLASLQSLLETGRGAPHPDIDFHRMVRR